MTVVRYPIRITDNPFLKPLLLAGGVWPGTSYVDLEGGALAVKMGIWFDERLPVDQIAGFGPGTWSSWSLGVKLGHGGVAVVGSSEGVVAIRFREPQTVRVLMPVHAETLWISLEDPQGFMVALARATGLPVSPPSTAP